MSKILNYCWKTSHQITNIHSEHRPPPCNYGRALLLLFSPPTSLLKGSQATIEKHILVLVLCDIFLAHLTWYVSVTWLQYNNSQVSITRWVTNHVTISVVLDVAGNHLVQGGEGGDVWVRFCVDDGDLERDIWYRLLECLDYWITSYIILWKQAEQNIEI